MTVSFVLDTNVLVYAHDDGSADKYQRAGDLIHQLASHGGAAVPAQVLAEFASVCFRKLVPTPTSDVVLEEIERLEAAFPVLPLHAGVVREAIRGVRDHRFAYCDAQIWAVARLAQAPFVLSEDFPVGARIEGVTFLDPLAADFTLSEWF